MGPLLDVSDLVVHFETAQGVVEAIDAASLTINQGEVVALVGESGCGKTTMARCILRVIPSPPGRIVSGSVTFKQRNLLALTDAECNDQIRGRAISLIPQDPYSSFNPLFTIGTQVREVAYKKVRKGGWRGGISADVRKEVEAKILEMLNRVHLPSPQGVLRKYPHELSGGQRQRIMIAMALLPRPDLLIADEPTTSLGVTIQAQITTILRRLVDEEGVSVLYITHDLGVAFGVSDRVVVMYAGQEVESAPTRSFFASPAHPYTNKLLDCLPNPEGIIQDIPGRVPALVNPPPGCRFAPRCDRKLDQCSQIKPPWEEIEPGHWLRCYHPILTPRPGGPCLR